MKLINGDCLEELIWIKSNSIDAVVTDPPYGLAFMNKKWDYDVPSTKLWAEVLRVLKPGGHLLSFGGTRTYHRMVVAIEDAGFEIRDQIMWIYGSGFPKSLDVSKAIDKAQGNEWARFFYCAKSSKRERSNGLNGFDCATLSEWQNEENTELAQSILRVISALIPNSSIVLSGENIMAIFPKECSFITRTIIQQITELKTWSLLIHSRTSASMKDAVSKLTDGTSLVEFAANSNELMTAIGILVEKAGSVTGAVNLATLKKLSKLSAESAWKTYSAAPT